MRKRVPWWALAILFVGLPLLEIYVIIQVGQVIGAWWTILLLLADGLFGAWLIKREGRRTWRALTETIRAGRMPATELADGILVLVGGTLMITPGFVTDVVGTAMILPFTRPIGRRFLSRFVAGKMAHRYEPPRPVVRGDVVD